MGSCRNFYNLSLSIELRGRIFAIEFLSFYGAAKRVFRAAIALRLQARAGVSCRRDYAAYRQRYKSCSMCSIVRSQASKRALISSWQKRTNSGSRSPV